MTVFVPLDALLDVLPDLIADAVRARTRPTPDAVTKSAATVMSVLGNSAEVQLDADEPGVFTTVQLAAYVAPGDRVAVLHSANGSALIVGSGSAQINQPVPTIDPPPPPPPVLTDDAGLPITDDLELAITTT